MKIFEYVGSLGDGGAETLVTNYCTMLNNKYSDIEASIVVLRNQPNTANTEIAKNSGTRIISILQDNRLPNKILYKLFGEKLVAYRLRKIIIREKPDIIHIHLNNLSVIKSVGKSIKGIKLFYTCHSVPEALFSGKNSREYGAAKHLIKNYDLQLIALHEDMASDLNKLFNVDNTVIIRNGIDLNRFRNIKVDITKKRRELDIPAESFVVGHVGRFAEVKNHDFTIRVFNELLNEKKNSFLLLIGDGPLKATVENKLKDLNIFDKVRILSNRTDVPELLNCMDVFLLPSFHEGLSVSLVEAQAVGLKCIVSDKINEANFLTEDTIPMDIYLSPSEWAKTIIRSDIKHKPSDSIDNYDLNKEIDILKNLYTER